MLSKTDMRTGKLDLRMVLLILTSDEMLPPDLGRVSGLRLVVGQLSF